MTTLKAMYIWDADYPWDVRTEKVCLALVEAGHEVHIAARNKARQALQQRLPEGTVHRMPPWTWVGHRADKLLSFPAFINPRWSRHVMAVARATRPDVLIVRDLPLCPLAIRIGRRLKRPVIFDMAENYPALLQDVWDTGRQRPFDRLVRSPRFARWVERYCLPRVDRILVVIQESADRLMALGVDPDRIAVVSNTPPRARIATVSPTLEPRKGSTELVYLGIMELARGIADLVDAVRQLREEGRQVRLRMIGGGRDKALAEEKAAPLIAAGHISFMGYIPSHTDALDVVKAADIGVIPHHASEWANTTIPNKLFDYMAAGLPVVTSDNIPCARIVRETGCGEVFRAQDARDLAAAIARLDDTRVRRMKGEAGLSAIRDTYNWETDKAVLLTAVAKTATR